MSNATRAGRIEVRENGICLEARTGLVGGNTIGERTPQILSAMPARTQLAMFNGRA